MVANSQPTLEPERPKCDHKECRRFGKPMFIYYTYVARFEDRPGEERTVVAYTCRPPKPHQPHHLYVWSPGGEIVRKVARGRFEFPDGAVSMDGLSLRWQNDEAFGESQRAVIQEMVKREDVREKRRAAGKRRHEANPTFMRSIAKLHIDDPEVNARWLTGLREGVKTPEARANMREGQKRANAVPGYLDRRNAAIKVGQAKRNARTLPADLPSKPQTWQRIVPLLVAFRAKGLRIGNREVNDILGLGLSKDTLSEIRRYCGCPGPVGRRSKK